MILIGPCGEGRVSVDSKFCIDILEATRADGSIITEVTLDQARAFCAARGARLCTEREWEAACRGAHHASFPYGRSYRSGRCNVKGDALAAPGRFQDCVSDSGAQDMSGNVAEWTDEGIVKGASWLDGLDGRCSRERREDPASSAPDRGYRCCGDFVF